MKSSSLRKAAEPKSSRILREAQPAASKSYWWAYGLGIFVALYAALEVYQPVLRAPFLFDDLYLPFTDPAYAVRSFGEWVRGARPLLMATYWVNFQNSGLDTFQYHVWNVLLHVLTSAMAWLIVRNLLARAGESGWRRETLAALAGAIFLLHPLQTESVAYVASRSESLSVGLAYAALAIFLYGLDQPVGWVRTVILLGLFGAATLSKEHTAVMPGALVLADTFWGRRTMLQSLRRHWRLFGPLTVAGGLGFAFVWRVLKASSSAGFQIKDLSWSQYFFSQCRAIWVYVRMFFLPYGQNVDHDFPISRSLIDHGAIFGLVGLVAVTLLAWKWRTRFPLASFGVFLFLLLIAPTSSVVPIMDLLVERRVYLPMVGLLLIVCEVLRHLPLRRWPLIGVAAVISLTLAALTVNRNQVWTSEIALWTDAVAKSPRKMRPRFQLAYAYFSAQQCGRAAEEYEKASQLGPVGTSLLVDWALAYDCAGLYESALAKLEEALEKEKTAHIYSLMGMVQAKLGHYPEAWKALDAAMALNPRFAMTYVYRGNLRMIDGDLTGALEEYRRALSFDPGLPAARDALMRAEAKRKAETSSAP